MDERGASRLEARDDGALEIDASATAGCAETWSQCGATGLASVFGDVAGAAPTEPPLAAMNIRGVQE